VSPKTNSPSPAQRSVQGAAKKPNSYQFADNLFEWLTPYRQSQGPVAPERNIDVFSERLRKLALRAAINPWPHNAMRHSFGSYFLGKTKDENLTASEMGNSPGVIVRHYRAVVRDADVTEYWRLRPNNIDPS